MKHQMTDIMEIANFVLAGNSIFTIKSANSGNHWTFRVQFKTRKSGTVFLDGLFFVQLMTAPQEFTYLGIIDRLTYRITSKSCRKATSTEHKVIQYLLKYMNDLILNKNFEFYHEGKCGRCGRSLTDPESIKRGIGPACAERS